MTVARINEINSKRKSLLGLLCCKSDFNALQNTARFPLKEANPTRKQMKGLTLDHFKKNRMECCFDDDNVTYYSCNVKEKIMSAKSSQVNKIGFSVFLSHVIEVYIKK